MSVTATLHRTEHDQGSAVDIHARIHELSALGWRARDISAVLQIHEQQVRQILEASPNRYATVSEPRRNPLGFEQAAEAHRRAWTR